MTSLISRTTCVVALVLCALALNPAIIHAEELALPKAFIDGTGPGWQPLGEADFVNVNCDPDTWTWKDGVVHCTGKPVGVIRTQEAVHQLRARRRSGGTSSSAATPASSSGPPRRRSKDLKPGKLAAGGIEVQVLDHGYAEQVRESERQESRLVHHQRRRLPRRHGEDEAVPARRRPTASAAFPRKKLSKGVGEWNHYYVRAINGEVRLWVNGEEVSGGTDCEPRTGYLCLESEGAPVEFKDIRIRELP